MRSEGRVTVAVFLPLDTLVDDLVTFLFVVVVAVLVDVLTVDSVEGRTVTVGLVAGL